MPALLDYDCTVRHKISPNADGYRIFYSVDICRWQLFKPTMPSRQTRLLIAFALLWKHWPQTLDKLLRIEAPMDSRSRAGREPATVQRTGTIPITETTKSKSQAMNSAG